MNRGPKERVVAKAPIVVVGMARSGTSFVARLLGTMEGTHLEMERHVLWKAGNFRYLADDQYNAEGSHIDWVRTKFEHNANGRQIVEKSPPNVLRPELVRAVFPDARIVYVERDIVRCIRSNVRRSLDRDSFKWSLTLPKYVLGRVHKRPQSGLGLECAAGGAQRAVGMHLWNQLRVRDVPAFTSYVAQMLWLRDVRKSLPFGPKLTGFEGIVRESGIVAYHVAVYRRALGCREQFRKLYGGSFAQVRLEELYDSWEAVQDLLSFCGHDVTVAGARRIQEGFNEKIVGRSLAATAEDEEIIRALWSDG